MRGNLDVSIHIHNHTENTDVTRSIKVSSGLETDLVISRVFESKLPYPYSNCQTDHFFENIGPNDRIKSSTFPYHQSDCFYLCQERAKAVACNYSKEFDEISQYHFTNLPLYSDTINRLENECNETNSSVIEDVNRRYLEEGRHKICADECPIECNRITYSISSHARFSNSIYASVNIYYEDFFYSTITEIPKTVFSQHFANIGGNFSLLIVIS